MYKKKRLAENYYLPSARESLTGERLLYALVLVLLVAEVFDKIGPDFRLALGKINLFLAMQQIKIIFEPFALSHSTPTNREYHYGI